MHRGPLWKEILWSQLWLVSKVPRPNGGGLSHFQYRTSTTQTAEDNDMNNDWGLILQQTLSYSSPHSCAHHPCLSCGFLPSLQLAERGIGVCTVRSIREVGFVVWVWAGQRSVWVSSVSSFRSANQRWRICCLYCSELWQRVGLLGCGIARSESSTFAVGRKVRCYNTLQLEWKLSYICGLDDTQAHSHRFPNTVDVKLQRHSFWYLLLHRFHLHGGNTGSRGMQGPSCWGPKYKAQRQSDKRKNYLLSTGGHPSARGKTQTNRAN